MSEGLSWQPWAIAVVASLVAMGIAGGFAALLGAVCAGIGGVVAARVWRRKEPTTTIAAGASALAEIATLVAVAALNPALVSPLVGG